MSSLISYAAYLRHTDVPAPQLVRLRRQQLRRCVVRVAQLIAAERSSQSYAVADS